ncbi:hypothetical protein IE4803_CH03930 [Rhizobium etli bv. phaseoli str. IE4803]|nr:hypothetical protein IE4803_CH03930 [Rhizobium etli bv. phaseoli str. IE4803]
MTRHRTARESWARRHSFQEGRDKKAGCYLRHSPPRRFGGVCVQPRQYSEPRRVLCQAKKGYEAMKAPPGAIDKERADAIDQHDRQGEYQYLQRA